MEKLQKVFWGEWVREHLITYPCQEYNRIRNQKILEVTLGRNFGVWWILPYILLYKEVLEVQCPLSSHGC